MSLDKDVEELKKEALEMGKYYFRGFGNYLNGISGSVQAYFYLKDEKYVNQTYGFFEELEKHYQKIPFEKLSGRKRFYPLLEINELLPALKISIDQFFREKREDLSQKLVDDLKTILDFGQIYFDSFQELLKKIRSYPESNDFRVKIVDYKFNVFYF